MLRQVLSLDFSRALSKSPSFYNGSNCLSSKTLPFIHSHLVTLVFLLPFKHTKQTPTLGLLHFLLPLLQRLSLKISALYPSLPDSAQMSASQ